MVVEANPPIYPAEALASGLGAAVLLEVDVSETGTVVGAEIATSAGGAFADAFDAAALAAIRGYRFQPARDADGEPMAARIQYLLRFVPTEAAAVSVEGRVRVAGTREPLAGAEVVLTGPDGAIRRGSTDADGTWRFAGLPDGEWTATVSSPGFDKEETHFTVQGGAVASVASYAVESRPWESTADLEIEVVGQRPVAEVTERVLGQEEIRYLPGTNGDVIKVIQDLPGVARSPLGIGQLLVRGTAPEDSAYYLDGSEIPIVFHFGGFSTVVNGDILQEVSLLPGNYSVRYGRQQGGVVELTTRTALPTRNRAYVAIDLFQATGFLDRKLGDHWSLTASARRSYIDAILGPVFGQIGLENVRAPRFYDGQLRLLDRLPSDGTLAISLLGSDDRFEILGDDEGEVEFGLGISFAKVQTVWTQPVGRWTTETSLMFGPEKQTFAVGADSEAYEKPLTAGLRHEWRRDAGPEAIGARLGVDLEGGSFGYLYDVVGFGERETGTDAWFAPGGYGEATLIAGPVSFTPGVRVDGWLVDQGTSIATVDPRFSARAQVSERVVVQGGLGRYSQFPQFRQVDPQTGERSLGPSDALQTSAGLEWAFHPGWSLGLTAFHDDLRSLVVGREDEFAFFTGPPPTGPLDTGPYANAGFGQANGLELLAKVETDRTVGWLAGTLERSTRTGRDGTTSLFAYDQPIVLTALASRELPKRWRLGARFRFGSGDPYTPVVNRVWNLDDRDWIPVFGEPTGERLPPFWQLDARFDKDWAFRKWTLTFYLDLQNATSHQNVEVMSWTPDYSAEQPIVGLPIVPAFGLRGEW